MSGWGAAQGQGPLSLRHLGGVVPGWGPLSLATLAEWVNRLEDLKASPRLGCQFQNSSTETQESVVTPFVTFRLRLPHFRLEELALKISVLQLNLVSVQRAPPSQFMHFVFCPHALGAMRSPGKHNVKHSSLFKGMDKAIGR